MAIQVVFNKNILALNPDEQAIINTTNCIFECMQHTDSIVAAVCLANDLLMHQVGFNVLLEQDDKGNPVIVIKRTIN